MSRFCSPIGHAITLLCDSSLFLLFNNRGHREQVGFESLHATAFSINRVANSSHVPPKKLLQVEIIREIYLFTSWLDTRNEILGNHKKFSRSFSRFKRKKEMLELIWKSAGTFGEN